MRYYSLEIFVNEHTGKLTLWGGCPAFGMVDHTPWKQTVRQVVLSRPEAKVFVNVYNRDVSNELIKRIAHDFVTAHK